jgi:hypothetical protein
MSISRFMCQISLCSLLLLGRMFRSLNTHIIVKKCSGITNKNTMFFRQKPTASNTAKSRFRWHDDTSLTVNWNFIAMIFATQAHRLPHVLRFVPQLIKKLLFTDSKVGESRNHFAMSPCHIQDILLHVLVFSKSCCLYTLLTLTALYSTILGCSY